MAALPLIPALLVCLLFLLVSSVSPQINLLKNDSSPLPVKFSFVPVSASVPWTGRYLHSSPVLADGTIVLVGGAKITAPISPPVDLSYRVTDIWSSSDRGVSWRLMAQTNPFTSRFAHTANSLGQMILFIGGTNLDGQLFNDVWTSVDSGATWRQGSWAPFSRRYGHAAVVDYGTNTLLIAGGCTSSPNAPVPQWRFSNDVFRSSDNAQTWTLQSDAAPWRPRMFHTAMVRQGIFFIAAGQGFDNSGSLVAFADVWQSLDQGSSWTMLTAVAGFGPRVLPLSVTYGTNMFIIGGTQASNSAQYPGNAEITSDVWMSADAGRTWVPAQKDSAFPVRIGASLALIDNQVFIMGGTSRSVNYADCWKAELPTASSTTEGTIVAGVFGSVLGLILLLLVLRRCGTRMSEESVKKFKKMAEELPLGKTKTVELAAV